MINKTVIKMKSVFLWVFWFVLSLIFVGGVFAYTPTFQDTANIADLESRLVTLVENDNIRLRDFYDQLQHLTEQYSNDDRLQYMLSTLKDFMYAKLFTLKTTAKVSSKWVKQDFVQQYNTGFSVNISGTLSNCTGWYNTLDDISFAYNFPTALTMATWYRESTCAYYLPSNGDGPFQIVNEDYGTWDITQDIFVKTVEDFLSYANSKFDRYEWQLSWYLSYTGFDLTGISNFAALYNGGTKSGNVILPNNESYLFDWYTDTYWSAIRYGIFPQFVKTLDWEINNKY